MSGHSKWHNIQAKKGKADAKRGKIFTKIGRELIIASKEGGADPDINSKLRDIVAKARANNMPQDTIMRAIKKGSGELEGVNYEEITYEGYGPHGVAFVVSTLTDNKNRTAANVRAAFSKSSGNLGETGCVGWMFQSKGQMIIERNKDMDEDEMMMIALEAGAEDFEATEEIFEIITVPESFGEIREKLEVEGFEFLSAEVTMIPDTTISISMDHASGLQKLIDKLEDDDDVQNVYHNAEFPEGWEE